MCSMLIGSGDPAPDTRKEQNPLQSCRYFQKVLSLHTQYGSVAQLNRASDYGSEGWGFDSLRSHQVMNHLQLNT